MHITTFLSTFLALGLSTLSVSAESTNFTLSSIGAYQAGGFFSSSTTKGFNFGISDPATGNTTHCSVSWDAVKDSWPRAMWLPCDDKTFAFKFDAYIDTGIDFRVDIELKHQYKDAGKPCGGKKNGLDCTISRAFTSLQDAWHATYGNHGGVSYSWDGTDDASVFSTCTGCLIRSGNY